MELTAGDVEYAEALDGADAALERLAAVDPASLSGEQKMQALGRLEQLRRRLDHRSCQLVNELDVAGGYQADGHRNAKAAVKHRCRVSGAEALRRVRTARAWRELPAVRAAYGAGEIPVETMRAIARHGTFGALHGAMLNQIFTTFEDAEFAADWDDAKEQLGEKPRLEQLERSPRQRRADALVALFRRAASTPADARSPEPLVNIVMSQEAFEAELTRLFTGSSRQAVEIQSMLRGRGGPKDVANGDMYCGVHNRLKERGFTPVRAADGTWTILRPDGRPITPAV